MRGKRTPPEKIEEIKALSHIYSPQTISARLQTPLRTVYEVLRKQDNPVIEARREQKRLEMVDKVWDKTEGDVRELKAKMDMILEVRRMLKPSVGESEVHSSVISPSTNSIY
jgi:hypothetical protein